MGQKGQCERSRPGIKNERRKVAKPCGVKRKDRKIQRGTKKKQVVPQRETRSLRESPTHTYRPSSQGEGKEPHLCWIDRVGGRQQVRFSRRCWSGERSLHYFQQKPNPLAAHHLLHYGVPPPPHTLLTQAGRPRGRRLG